jgi:hypothetical protein
MQWPPFTSGAPGLETCPLCGSSAVSAQREEEAEHGRRRLLLHCGECGTWRGCVVGPRAVRALARRLRRDRERMARALMRGAGAGMPLEARRDRKSRTQRGSGARRV